jgi:PAS domain S-box-containing protein
MNKSAKYRVLGRLALLAGLGLLGLFINFFPLKLFPHLSLLFGSALVVALAARLGPGAGGMVGAIAGSKMLWLQPHLFPFSIPLMAGEGLWVGYFSRRRGWRPLFASITYWLVFGCWVVAALHVFVQKTTLLTTSLLTLRFAFNAVINALIAELLLIVVAYVNYRRGKSEEGFRVGLASTVGMVMVLAIGFTAIFGVAAIAKTEAAKANDKARLKSLAEAVEARRALNTRVAGTYRSMAYMADLMRVQRIQLSDTSRLNSMLEVLKDQQDELGGVCVADAAGRTVAISDHWQVAGKGSVRTDHSDKPYYRNLVQTKQAVFSGVFKPSEDGVQTAAIAFPIMKDKNTLEGFILGWYKPEIFAELARRFSQEEPGLDVTIFDSEGLVVADSRNSGESPAVGRRFEDSLGAIVSTRDVEGSRILSNDAWSLEPRIDTWERSRSRVVAWSVNDDLRWTVIVSRPMLPIEQDLARHNLQLLEALLGLVLLSLFVSNAVGNRLARPLLELESYALRLAAGDLSTRPSASFVITHEANLLRTAFSKMADELERSSREQRAMTRNAEVAAGEAHARATHVAALNELGKELSLTFDLPSICRAAHRYIKTQVEASGFLISLYSETEQLIKPAFIWGDGKEFDITVLPTVPLGSGAHSQCIRTKSPVLVEDIGANRTYKTQHFFGTEEDPRTPESVVYLPLISFDKVVGTLQVQGYSRAQFQTEDIERLMAVASQIAVSMSNAMLFEQIREAKTEWEKTFDSMSDGVFLFDENGTLIRANHAGADMEGMDIRSLIGKRCCEFLASEGDHECVIEASIKHGRRINREIVTVLNSRTLQLTIEPVDTQGRVHGSICVARDITELRRAEEEARVQREFAAQLVESAQEAIFTFNVYGRVTWSNQRFCAMTGYTADDAQSFDVRSLVHADDLPGVEECVARVFQGANESYQARFLGVNGDTRWFETTLTPVTSQDEITSVLAVTRDVTDERIASEQLERANKLAAVGQLAAGVAHDFNNLLVPILGRAQLLKRQLSDPSARRGLEVIEKAALDGAATVRRLQNFSRRHSEDKMEPVEVDDLLRDVVELTRTRWRDDALARGIKYEISLSFGEGSMVMASASELREVFTNIIINALDAMPDGGRLTIKSQTEEPSVRVSISDTGGGMPESVRKHIFEPFFSTKGHAGNGLGLAVSYGIIERHSGSIKVDSASGLGSTFTITLPLTLSRQSEEAALAPANETRARILVVDDEELVRLTLVDILESMGHEVISVESGREGLLRLSTSEVDLVLTDLSMPEMDGWTFAGHIRERFPQVKTVLVTGYGATMDLQGEMTKLVDAVVGKPYEYDEVAMVIERLVNDELPCAVS